MPPGWRSRASSPIDQAPQRTVPLPCCRASTWHAATDPRIQGKSMHVPITTTADDAGPGAAPWSAVLAMTLCAFVLVSSEFLPVSLLTPMARDMIISEGQAGQAIAASGLFAVLTSLSISSLTRKLDRKLVILWLTGLMIVSSAIVAFAPSYSMPPACAPLSKSARLCWSLPHSLPHSLPQWLRVEPGNDANSRQSPDRSTRTSTCAISLPRFRGTSGQLESCKKRAAPNMSAQRWCS